jgi:DNA-binding NtrC family response regulator
MTNILIVDDDPLQASVVMSALDRHFGNVRRVTDAAEAFCLIEQPDFADNLGLVITGHHTPGMGGPAFVAELRSRKPDLPVLVLGARGSAASDYKDDRVVFLPRPVGGDTMRAVTGRLLAEYKKAAA